MIPAMLENPSKSLLGLKNGLSSVMLTSMSACELEDVQPGVVLALRGISVLFPLAFGARSIAPL